MNATPWTIDDSGMVVDAVGHSIVSLECWSEHGGGAIATIEPEYAHLIITAVNTHHALIRTVELIAEIAGLASDDTDAVADLLRCGELARAALNSVKEPA